MDHDISYLVCDGEKSTVINGVPCKVPWTEGGWRRPDMADPVTFDVFEIKPKGSEDAGQQVLTEYIDLLRYHDLLKRNWHRGNNYLPSVGPPPIGNASIMNESVRITIYDPVDGVIIYDVDDDQLRERVAQSIRVLADGSLLVGEILGAMALTPIGI